MASEIAQAYVQIIPKMEGVQSKLEEGLGGVTKSLGKTAGSGIMSGLGTAFLGAAGAVATGATAISGAVAKGVTDLGAYGDNIDKTAQKMGISAEAYQEWDAVLQHSGTNIGAMQKSMRSLTGAVESGSEAFQKIGISADQLESMSREEIFSATISGLQGIEDEATRAALANDLLGRGSMELGALLNTSAEDTQAMRDRVHELGGVLSDEAVKNSAAFQDNLQDLQTAIAGVGRGLAADLLPGVNQILGGFTSLMTGGEDAADQISAGFSALFSDLTGIISNVVDTISQMMPMIVSTITEILPQLVSLGTQLVVSLAGAILQSAPEIINAIFQMAGDILSQLSAMLTAETPSVASGGVSDFISGIMSALPDVLSQGMEIITSLLTGIINALPEIITGAGEAISTFVASLMDALPQIWESGTQMLLSVVKGISENMPQIVTATVQVVGMLTKTILEHLPEILQSGISILLELLAGLIKAIPDLVAGIPQIIQSIVNTFHDFEWADIGHEIMEGIKNGILSKIDSVIEAAKNGAQSILDAAKGFLQIGSPSRKFADEVGRWIPEGIALGIRDNMDSVTDEMQAAAELTELAYQTAVTAPDLEVNANKDETLVLILQLLMQYFPEFAENRGADVSDIYNVINRQMGMAIL